MDADNGALSLDSAVELLRTPEEQAQPEAQAEPEPAEEENEIPAEAEAEPEGEEQQPLEADEATEEPASPAVEPPPFWTQAGKEVFATLPPEVQQEIARNHKAGEAHVNRIQQEIAAERKAYAEQQAALEQERAQYQEALLSNFPQPPNPALIDSDPVEYLRQDAMYKQAVQQWQIAEHQRQQETEKQQAKEQAERQQFEQEQKQELVKLLPEIADPVEGPKLAQAIYAYGQELGYDTEILGEAMARDLVTLDKARRWDAAQAAAKAAKTTPLPKVAAPGVSRSRSERDAEARKATLARLERTGSIEDAVAALRT